MVDFSKVSELDWDKGNIEKNRLKHGVYPEECEQVFNNPPTKIYKDHKHSNGEERFLVFGKTFNERNLTMVITIRNNKIRVISARSMNKKERIIYEEDN